MQSVNAGMENNIEKIFEDEYIVVINKPAGLIVHSDGRNEEASVADWVLEHYPEVRDIGEPWVSPQGEVIPRPGIVHRLDRTTSGVMIIAKTQESFESLKEQFKDRLVEKTYDALVYDHPKNDEGLIEMEIGRTKKKPRKWIALFAHGKKRAAITQWFVEGRYVDPETQVPVTHMRISPKTGRTHQIRVHLKAIHHPIVCDHLYATNKPCILGLSRPALHAREISFMNQGERVAFEAPLPEDMRQAFDRLSKL